MNDDDDNDDNLHLPASNESNKLVENCRCLFDCLLRSEIIFVIIVIIIDNIIIIIIIIIMSCLLDSEIIFVIIRIFEDRYEDENDTGITFGMKRMLITHLHSPLIFSSQSFFGL